MELKVRGNSIEQVVLLNGKILAEHDDHCDLSKNQTNLSIRNLLSGALNYRSLIK